MDRGVWQGTVRGATESVVRDLARMQTQSRHQGGALAGNGQKALKAFGRISVCF